MVTKRAQLAIEIDKTGFVTTAKNTLQRFYPSRRYNNRKHAYI